MGHKWWENCYSVNMSVKLTCLLSLVVVASAAPQEKDHNLPVLFQFSQPSHNVAVFRGADLKKAIAAGLVPGFGSLGNSANSAGNGDEGRDGRSDDGDDSGDSSDGGDGVAPSSYVEPATEAPTTAAPVTTAAPTTAPTLKIVSSYRPAPVVYRPAPVVYKQPVIYKPAPVVYKQPLVYKPAPAPVVYNPAPAPVVYKPAPVIVKPAAPKYKPAPYVEPAYAQDALYTFEYAVKDDYTNNDFGAKEARDGILTNGKYSVALPDGRLQTVTYTVDGGEGYVPVVEYAGEAQYPPTPAPYSS